MRGLRFTLPFLAFLLAPIPAPAAADAPVADKAAVERLIGTLENDAERARLIGQLKLMIQASEPASTPDSPVEELSQLAIETVAGRINRFSVQLWEALDFSQAGRRINAWIERLTADPTLRTQLLETLLRLLTVFGAAIAAEAIARVVLSRPRGSLETRVPRNRWSKAGHLLILGAVELVPLALFAITANLMLPATGGLSDGSSGPTTELMAATLLNGFVLARAVALAARLILAPRAPSLRLPPIEDESAQYLHIWARRFTDLWIYGVTILDALIPLGLPRIGHAVLHRVLGLTLAMLVAIFILQNRQAVAGALRGNGEEKPAQSLQQGLLRLRQGLAGCWHGLAIFYVAVIYLVWALDVPGGFQFIVQRTLGTAAVALGLWVLSAGLRLTIDRAFHVADELKARYPLLESRANLYLPMLRRMLNAVVWIGGIVLLLQIWGVDSLVWLTSDQGRRLVSMLVTIAFAIGLGALVWETASAVIERAIRRLKDQHSRNARLRTFLPLLKTVIFVAIIVIVSLTVLSELGINIAPLLAGAGVVGLAIGFGSQALVKDVITGMFILFEDTINVGDVVDLDGKSGSVEAISLRTIRLRDGQGSQLTIPFSAVTTIKNMTRDYGYYPFNLSIAYDQDLKVVEDALRTVDAEMREDPEWQDRIMGPIEIFGIDKFGDYAVTVSARIKTRPSQQWSVGREYNRRIKLAFAAAGIEVPYPTSVQMTRTRAEPGGPAEAETI